MDNKKTHHIISKGTVTEAHLHTIKNTVAIMKSHIQKEPNITCDCSLYVRDVEFLLGLIGERS